MSASNYYVDDTDSTIRYDDGWTLSRNTEIVGVFGPPLYGTLHIANSAAQFSYSFTGSYIEVNFLITQGKANEPDVNCTVDGVALDRPIPASSSPSSTSCFNQHLPHNGTHELVVSVVGTPSNPVIFDYISYSGPQVVTDADFIHSSVDPAVTVSDPNSSNATAYPLPPGATLNIAFDGYSIGLYGTFTFKTTHSPSFASYTLDGANPTNFTIGNPVSSSDIGNGIFMQLILQTPRYPVGKHNLQVVFFGTNETTPLYLSTYVVQNSTTNNGFPQAMPDVSAIDTSATGAPSSLPIPTNQPSSKEITHHIHPIILGVVAVVVFALFLSIAIIWFLRGRRKRDDLRLMNRLSGTIISPFEHQSTQQYAGKEGLYSGNEPSASKNDNWVTRSTIPQSYRSSGTIQTRTDPSTVTSSPGMGSRRVLIHEDSGAAISQPGTNTGDILELPPMYTTISLHRPSPSI